jgi:oligoendopeptidase F
MTATFSFLKSCAAFASQTQARDRAAERARLGALPEWNLADLYASPQSETLKKDLETGERAADAMHENYAG